MVHWGENERPTGACFLISSMGTPPVLHRRAGMRLKWIHSDDCSS